MNRRRLLSVLPGLGLLPVLPACAAQDAPKDEEAPKDIAGLLSRTGAPALAGAVFDAEGLKHLEFGGVRRRGRRDPVGRDELWHLGSNSKAMTAALYGRLVDQGKARWGAPLGELFDRVDPAFARQPVEALMGHRSGILDAPVMRGGYLLRAHGDKRPPAVQRAELAAELLAKPPAGPVGTFAYSNLGYVVLGAAIERIAGRSWEEAVTEALFRPLGMASAGFGAPRGDNAWGHRPALAGLVGPLQAVDPSGLADNPAVLGPAGRVHASVADYGRFLRLFLGAGGEGLTPATVKALTAPLAGEGRPYALGWGVAEPPWARGPVLVHEGSNTMWHAVAAVAPARGLAIVGVANGPPEATKGAARDLAALLRRRFAPD